MRNVRRFRQLDWPWKLHNISGRKKKSGSVTTELYNLETDPLEANDVSADQQDRVHSMQQELTSWRRSVIHSLNGGDYP